MKKTHVLWLVDWYGVIQPECNKALVEWAVCKRPGSQESNIPAHLIFQALLAHRFGKPWPRRALEGMKPWFDMGGHLLNGEFLDGADAALRRMAEMYPKSVRILSQSKYDERSDLAFKKHVGRVVPPGLLDSIDQAPISGDKFERFMQAKAAFNGQIIVVDNSPKNIKAAHRAGLDAWIIGDRKCPADKRFQSFARMVDYLQHISNHVASAVRLCRN
ncbi:MAG: hypothetical protein LBH41_00540 [Rickettsiales bacterium]|nr:hypothetical protein [Rickettsiales bacterium]